MLFFLFISSRIQRNDPIRPSCKTRYAQVATNSSLVSIVRDQLTKNAIDQALIARGLPASISQIEAVEASAPIPPAPAADGSDTNVPAASSPSSGLETNVAVGGEASGERKNHSDMMNVSGNCSMPEGPIWQIFDHVRSNSNEADSGWAGNVRLRTTQLLSLGFCEALVYCVVLPVEKLGWSAYRSLLQCGRWCGARYRRHLRLRAYPDRPGRRSLGVWSLLFSRIVHARG
jgi:hypothetical protein